MVGDKSKEPKPYKDICSASCWTAKGKRCVCRCKGKYHGQGLVKKAEKKDEKESEES